MCDYSTTCGRDDKALIQINATTSYSFAELAQQYGAALLNGMATNVSNATHIDPASSYYHVLSIITNKDAADPTPVYKVSYLGQRRDSRSNALPAEVCIAQINTGSYDVKSK